MIKYAHVCGSSPTRPCSSSTPGCSPSGCPDGADAVLITHEHADHLDLARSRGRLGARPAVWIFTNAAVVGRWATWPTSRPRSSRATTSRRPGCPSGPSAAGNADIHPTFHAYQLRSGRRLALPSGRLVDVPPGTEVDTLFVPISAPWLKASESTLSARSPRSGRSHCTITCPARLGSTSRRPARDSAARRTNAWPRGAVAFRS